MFTIKTLNAISPVGLAKLNKNLFDVSVDTTPLMASLSAAPTC